MTAASVLYTATALLLAAYALNSLILIVLFLRHRSVRPTCGDLARYPRVTVQVPVYNEATVIERLIEAIVQLDWPRDRLQVQVLDDSTDETTAIARACVERHRGRGFDIELVHRADRRGFKAGALREGLERASGELIAIFDADFVPAPDWLRRVVPHFLHRPRLGMVQTRWTHLNRTYSLLTRAQALALDGHFGVEQTARQRAGLLFSFNGTAGMWRRECIAESGGWQSDTLCEDLDLSFRAQLEGWQCLYLPDVTAPAEIPPQLAALKRQQFRWAKGSIQCLLKLAGPLARSSLPLAVRGLAFLHLSTYLVHPFLLVSLLATLPLVLSSATTHFSMGLVSILSLAPPLMYAMAQLTLHRDRWLRHYAVLPALMLLGTGIALNNTRGVCEAILGVNNVFQRTPKFGVEGSSGRWRDSRYALPCDGIVVGELALAGYALVTALMAWWHGYGHLVPFLMLYVGGFGYVGSMGLWEARSAIISRLRRFVRVSVSSREMAPLPMVPASEYRSTGPLGYHKTASHGVRR